MASLRMPRRRRNQAGARSFVVSCQLPVSSHSGPFCFTAGATCHIASKFTRIIHPYNWRPTSTSRGLPATKRARALRPVPRDSAWTAALFCSPVGSI